MQKGLRLVDLNNYLNIAYMFKISQLDLNNYLNIAKMKVEENRAAQETSQKSQFITFRS